MSKILRRILWVLFLTHPLLLVRYHYLVVNFCNYRNFCAAAIIQESSIVNPALFAKTRIKTIGKREEKTNKSKFQTPEVSHPHFCSFWVIFKLSGFSLYAQSKKFLDFSVPNINILRIHQCIFSICLQDLYFIKTKFENLSQFYQTSWGWALPSLDQLKLATH